MVKAREKDERVTRARNLRSNPTDAERKLWQYLRKVPVSHCHFRRQATIGPFFADFACHTTRLIIEWDGGQHSTESDRSRTAYLKIHGYRVLRFWNHDILNKMDGVMETIVAALEKRPPTPDPSPPQERGEGKTAYDDPGSPSHSMVR